MELVEMFLVGHPIGTPGATIRCDPRDVDEMRMNGWTTEKSAVMPPAPEKPSEPSEPVAPVAPPEPEVAPVETKARKAKG